MHSHPRHCPKDAQHRPLFLWQHRSIHYGHGCCLDHVTSLSQAPPTVTTATGLQDHSGVSHWHIPAQTNIAGLLPSKNPCHSGVSHWQIAVQWHFSGLLPWPPPCHSGVSHWQMPAQGYPAGLLVGWTLCRWPKLLMPPQEPDLSELHLQSPNCNGKAGRLTLSCHTNRKRPLLSPPWNDETNPDYAFAVDAHTLQ